MKNLIFILLFIPISIYSQDWHIEQRMYEYDNLNRLVKVVFHNGTIYEYTYDDLGNRLQKNISINPIALTYVPDDNFEQELINLGYDDVMDDYVVTDNINSIVFLQLSYKDIDDVTGIEDFISLEILYFETNNLTEIDISQNINLNYFSCSNNEITEIDVTNNILLKNLNISYNLITSIDVSNNTALELLSARYNQLNSLDVSNNPNLRYIWCSDNPITSLDFSQNPNLYLVNCENSSLLSEFNLKNGNNSILTSMGVENSPNLYCIEVDDEIAANNGDGVYSNWNVNPIVVYSESCILGIDDIDISSDILITPNPTDNYLTILFPETIISNESTIIIYDINGRLLINKTFEMNNKEVQVPVNKLSNGIYFIKAIISQQKWVQKFIKN
jgi:YD repeat-containing protein